MPFGDSLPLSLLSFLIFFHLSLGSLQQTHANSLRCNRMSTQKEESYLHMQKEVAHTHRVLAIADSWRCVTTGRYPPISNLFISSETSWKSWAPFVDKQHEDELSVSVAEKIGSRRKEKSEERKGAKRSESARQWMCSRWCLEGEAASSSIINEDNLIKKHYNNFLTVSRCWLISVKLKKQLPAAAVAPRGEVRSEKNAPSTSACEGVSAPNRRQQRNFE